MPDAVSFQWYPDDEFIGKLQVSARANGFSGKSGAWFDRTSILAFADALADFPLPDVADLVGGFGEHEEQAAQDHVRISAYRVGDRGQVALGARLATEQWPDTRPTSVHQVRLELLTSYERFKSLSRDLRSLLDGRLAEAEIEAEVF